MKFLRCYISRYFKLSPVRNVIGKLIALRQKNKDEGIAAMQLLVKLLINSLYGEYNRKDMEEKFVCKSQVCMMSEYDERVKRYWKILMVKLLLKWLMTLEWKMKRKI